MKVWKKAGILTLNGLTLGNVTIPTATVVADELDRVVAKLEKDGVEVSRKSISETVNSKKLLKAKEDAELVRRNNEAKRLEDTENNHEKLFLELEKTWQETEKKNQEIDKQNDEEKKRIEAENHQIDTKNKAEAENVAKENEAIRIRNKQKSDTYEQDKKRIEVENKKLTDEYTKEKIRVEAENEKIKKINDATKKKNVEQLRLVEEQNKKLKAEFEKAKQEYDKKKSEHEAEKIRIEKENKEGLLNNQKREQLLKENENAKIEHQKEVARIEKENKDAETKAEADYRHAQRDYEQKQSEYRLALDKWNKDKEAFEVVKTREIYSSEIDKAVQKANADGVDVTLNSEKSITIDGTITDKTGEVTKAISDAVAKANLDIQTATAKTKEAHALEKENLKKNEVFKQKLKGSYPNLPISFEDGKRELDASEYTKLQNENPSAGTGTFYEKKAAVENFSKLYKVREDALKGLQSSTIQEWLKRQGIDDATALRLSQTAEIVRVDLPSLLPNQTEYALKKELDAKLQPIRSDNDRAVNEIKNPTTGTNTLDSSSFDQKLKEYREKVKHFYDTHNVLYGAKHGIESDIADFLSFDHRKSTNNTTMNVVSTTGNVTYYQTPDIQTTDNSNTKKLFDYANVMNPGLPTTHTLTTGMIGKVQYAAIKLAKGASITIDYKPKDGKPILPAYDMRLRNVTYKVIGGEKVATDATTLRYTFTNNGSDSADGSAMFFLTNDVAAPVYAYYAHDIPMSDTYADVEKRAKQYQLNYTYSYQLLDNTDRALSVGRRTYEYVNPDSINTAFTPKLIIQTLPPDETKEWYTWGSKLNGNDLFDENHGNHFNNVNTAAGPSKPDDNTWYADTHTHSSTVVENGSEYKVTMTSRHGTGMAKLKSQFDPVEKNREGILSGRLRWQTSPTYSGGTPVQVITPDQQKFEALEPFPWIRRGNSDAKVKVVVPNNSESLTVTLPYLVTKPHIKVTPVRVIYRYKEKFKTLKPDAPTDKVPVKKPAVKKVIPLLTLKDIPPLYTNKMVPPFTDKMPTYQPILPGTAERELPLLDMPKPPILKTLPQKPLLENEKTPPQAQPRKPFPTLKEKIPQGPKPEKGHLRVDVVAYTFTFEPITHFEDESGTEIKTQENGSHAKVAIPGWVYLKTIEDEDGHIHHIYKRVKTSYKDHEGKDIIPPQDGEKPKQDIPGYEFVETKKDKDGNVTHIYKKKVKTSYKDPEGKDIIPPQDGEKPKQDIPGYEFVETKKDKDGNVTHIYKKKAEPIDPEPPVMKKIRTNFVREDGHHLLPPEDGEHDAKIIAGYRLLDTKRDKDGNVTHIYKKNVKTFFKDPHGNDINPPVDGEVNYKDIPGYDFIETKKDKNGNVTHIYKKKVKTFFKDPNGNDINPPVDGEVNYKDIPGYDFVETKKDKNGNVTHIYKKKVKTFFKDPNGHDITPPVDGEVNYKDIPGYDFVETKKDKDGNVTHIYKKKVKELPKTGDVSVLGLGALTGLASFLIKRRKKR